MMGVGEWLKIVWRKIKSWGAISVLVYKCLKVKCLRMNVVWLSYKGMLLKFLVYGSEKLTWYKYNNTESCGNKLFEMRLAVKKKIDRE